MRLYTTSELAALAGITRRYVSQLVQDGKLVPDHHTECGHGEFLFTLESIEAFIEARGKQS